MDADVIIVGAGIAGLTCARQLELEGREALILEAGDEIGGRVRTDRVDGYRFDRGFQVFQEAYPEARRHLDYEALDLRAFAPGALVWTGGGFERAVDPRRAPWSALKSSGGKLGAFRDKARLAKLWSALELLHRDGISTGDERLSTREALSRYGFGNEIIERFLRPLFAGAMVDPDLENSSLLFDFIFRTFASGETSVPAGGMDQIPRQIASRLNRSPIQLASRVEHISAGNVVLEDGQRLRADAIVVATDATAACELVDGLDTCAMRPSTTLYFGAPAPPFDEKLLVLDGTGDGPINSLTVLTNVAPEYAPADRALISASVLELPDDEPRLVARCRGQLSRWFDDVAAWEHLRTYVIERSLPAQTPETMPPVHKPVDLGDGVYVCGDHRDTASINGAMLSARKVAEAIVDRSRPRRPPPSDVQRPRSRP